MTTYIQLVSGPGAGKTTIASLLFGQMKIAGFTAEYVQEYAKSLVWKNDWEKLNDQYHVSREQYLSLIALKDRVRYVITDGSLIPGLYYNRVNERNISNPDKTEEAILSWFRELPSKVIFLKRDNFPYEVAGRTQDYEQALAADQGILDVMERHSIPYTIFRSRPESIPGMIDFLTENK